MSYSTTNNNPYETCPVYETESFIIRKVLEDDAEDLLVCYSDPEAAGIFNSDNCTSSFIYRSLDEMKECIGFWLDQYEEKYYVRFSVVDKKVHKAVGTVEMFTKSESFNDYGRVGVLRVDLSSVYEKARILREIFDMTDDNFYDCFEADSIMTKAVPQARERIEALKASGYRELESGYILPYDYYYIRER